MPSSKLGRLAVSSAFAMALAATSLSAQSTGSAQNRLWDAAIAGDTVAIVAALGDGAKLDSLDTRANPNGRLALNWAAWYDRVPAIRVLLASGADIHAVNRTGFTALHHAAEAGSKAAAEALLEAGADASRPNRGGRLPAEIARGRGHDAIAEMLDAAAQAGRD